MPSTLTASLKPTLTMTFTEALTQGNLVDTLTAGTPSLASFNLSFPNGTGASNVALRHSKQYSFASGATTLDFTSLAIDRPPGGNQTFALIQLFVMRIVTPATGVYLTLGANGSNPWVGFFGSTTGTHEVRTYCIEPNPIDGWAVSGTSKILKVNNPGGSAVIADFILLGQ